MDKSHLPIHLMKSLFTIIHKEWVEFKAAFFTRLNLYSGYLSVFILMVICGIYMPFIRGLDWNGSTSMVFTYILVVPFCVVGTIIPASFIQEREMHTLEMLLATPAPDAAILLGKISMPTLYGWISALVCAAANLLVVNFFIPHNGLLLFPLNITICLILFSFLLSFTIAAIGALSSLHSRSYIQAQGKLTAIVFGPMFTSAFLLGPLSPLSWKTALSQILGVIGYPNYLFIYAILLILLNLLIVIIGLNKFNRKQVLSNSTIHSS